jgi:hypothetical protein
VLRTHLAKTVRYTLIQQLYILLDIPDGLANVVNDYVLTQFGQGRDLSIHYHVETTSRTNAAASLMCTGPFSQGHYLKMAAHFHIV